MWVVFAIDFKADAFGKVGGMFPEELDVFNYSGVIGAYYLGAEFTIVCTFHGGHVEGGAFGEDFLRDDAAVRFLDEVFCIQAVPVVAAGGAGFFVHALLDYSPSTVSGK